MNTSRTITDELTPRETLDQKIPLKSKNLWFDSHNKATELENKTLCNIASYNVESCAET